MTLFCQIFRRPKPLTTAELILQTLERIEKKMATPAQFDALKTELSTQNDTLKDILEEVKADAASHQELPFNELKDKADENGAILKQIQEVLGQDNQPTPDPATDGTETGTGEGSESETGT